MESAQAPITYRINTRVAGVKLDHGKWFILFEGSWEWLGLDADQPTLAIGDRVSILIQKA